MRTSLLQSIAIMVIALSLAYYAGAESSGWLYGVSLIAAGALGVVALLWVGGEAYQAGLEEGICSNTENTDVQ